MYTYSPATHPGARSEVLLFVDSALTVPATITDGTGTSFPVKFPGGSRVPLPAHRLELNNDGSWPTFRASTSPLWFRASAGATCQIFPELSHGAPVPVTGSRGTALATVVENLIQALVTAGVPITDQTTT